MLSFKAALLIFSVALSTMPHGIVSIQTGQCIYAIPLPCDTDQDCPPECVQIDPIYITPDESTEKTDTEMIIPPLTDDDQYVDITSLHNIYVVEARETSGVYAYPINDKDTTSMPEEINYCDDSQESSTSSAGPYTKYLFTDDARIISLEHITPYDLPHNFQQFEEPPAFRFQNKPDEDMRNVLLDDVEPEYMNSGMDHSPIRGW
ncbi:hypothetical protein Scep_025367 [Stephania cephalantha]|uniref:Uncharacterized protein n=1 Tax=Stephania cephalantha TaxID=152367 RepID=A0AAP0HM94_9MAGN